MIWVHDLGGWGIAEEVCPADFVERGEVQAIPMPEAIMCGEAHGQDVVDMTRGAATLEDQPACRYALNL